MDSREIKDKLVTGWLHVHIIFEVLGKPVEYVEETINKILEKLEEEKNLEIIEKIVHKSKAVEKTENVFSTFSEVEILINNLSRLVEIIFDYMPSSIEIVEPINMTFKLEDANALLNDLAIRLHKYDAVVKKLKLEREFLIKKLEEEKKKTNIDISTETKTEVDEKK